jgi:hypothetical protein
MALSTMHSIESGVALEITHDTAKTSIQMSLHNLQAVAIHIAEKAFRGSNLIKLARATQRLIVTSMLKILHD